MIGLLTAWQNWRERRNAQKYCFHHDTFLATDRVSMSWIEQQLIETGKAKMFWCTQCGKTWII
jgi:hypothetical protein